MPADPLLPTKPKRIRRACDLCNLWRTRCDGETPCSHCIKVKSPCTYLRAEKKRGRASDKYPKHPKRRPHRDAEAAVTFSTGQEPPVLMYPRRTEPDPPRPEDILLLLFDWGEHDVCRHPVVEPHADWLQQAGVLCGVACDLLEMYFRVRPQLGVWLPLVRPFLVLQGPCFRLLSRPLLLLMMVVAAVNTHHALAPLLHTHLQQQLMGVPAQLMEDAMVYVHLVALPLLGTTRETLHHWLTQAWTALQHLGGGLEVDLGQEEANEEHRRLFWHTYVMDTAVLVLYDLPLARGLDSVRGAHLYHPCSEATWLAPHPLEMFPHEWLARLRGFLWHALRPGPFGYALPMIMAMTCAQAVPRLYVGEGFHHPEQMWLQEYSATVGAAAGVLGLGELATARLLAEVLLGLGRYRKDPHRQLWWMGNCMGWLSQVVQSDRDLVQAPVVVRMCLWVLGGELAEVLPTAGGISGGHWLVAAITVVVSTATMPVPGWVALRLRVLEREEQLGSASLNSSSGFNSRTSLLAEAREDKAVPPSPSSRPPST